MENQPHMPRPYDLIAQAVAANLRDSMTLEERMRLIVDALWNSLAAPHGPISWVGFYLPAPDRQSLILGPMRNKPACSPIALHGVCGQSFLTQKAILIQDTATLGDNYIACDPRDRSEVVIPILNPTTQVAALLDVDSHQINAFDWSDITGLARILTAANLQPAG